MRGEGAAAAVCDTSTCGCEEEEINIDLSLPGFRAVKMGGGLLTADNELSSVCKYVDTRCTGRPITRKVTLVVTV